MNCPHCNKDELLQDSIGDNNLNAYQCQNCRAEFYKDAFGVLQDAFGDEDDA